MRTIIQLTDLVDYFDSDYIFSPFYSFLPDVFYQAIGLNKSELNLSLGMYLSDFDEESQNVGYRLTVFGEIFLAFSYTGVVIFYLIITSLSYMFERFMTKSSLTYVLILMYFALLVPYGMTFVRSSLIMLPFSILIIRIFSSFKYR
jgi:hypothetical protein